MIFGLVLAVSTQLRLWAPSATLLSALSPDFLEDAAGFYHSAAAIDTTLHVGARCPAKGSGCVRRSDVYTSDVYSDRAGR